MAGSPETAQAYLKVQLQGVDISANVRCVEVDDNDHLIDRAVIVFDDPVGDMAAVPREGQRVQIDMGWYAEHAVLFEGEVQRFVVQTHVGAGLRGRLTAYDLSCRMMQGAPKTRDHTGTLSKILKAIVQDYPVQAGDITPVPDYDFTQQPLRQMNQLDWQFIQALAERFGARAFVEYNAGASRFYWVAGSRLLQGAAVGELKYTPGFGHLQTFRYERLAVAAAAPQTAVVVAPTTGEGAPTTPPVPPAPETAPSPLPGPRSPGDMLPKGVAAGVPSDPNPAVQVTPADPTRQYGLFGEGVATGSVKLRSKAKLTISGLAPWAAGDWYVRRATHIYTAARRYHTRFVVTR